MIRPTTRPWGLALFAAYLACIPLANWLIGHAGTVCIPDGPCLIPVAPGILAPSGVLVAGLALVLRDMTQRFLGLRAGLAAVLAGTALSALVAPAPLVIASASAFLLSELADTAIYTPLARRRLMLAVAASAAAGLVIDSVVFLALAFHSLAFIEGQIIGKSWAVLASLPLVHLTRRLAPTPA